MKKQTRLLLTSLTLASIFFLTACVSSTKQGVPTGQGFFYNFFVAPMGQLIRFFAVQQELDFGLAIIIVTLLVRFVIMPLGIYQSWKSAYQSEKMQYLKPILDPIQKRMKEASSQEEQLAAQQAYFAAQKEHGVSMLGGMGCLPLLIQMPFFTALFYASRYTEGIAQADFMGINLGTPSLVLTAIAGVLYFAQSWMMQIGMDEEQQKQMRAMLFMNPLMILMFSWNSPAGLTLYWVVGGVIGLIQQAITSFVIKPRIRAKIEEEFQNKPLTAYQPSAKDVTPTTSAILTDTNKPKNRNAGKQRSR